jgi:hypothetical protein
MELPLKVGDKITIEQAARLHPNDHVGITAKVNAIDLSNGNVRIHLSELKAGD